MPIRTEAEALHLEAVCGVEEALALLEQLAAAPPPGIDLSACTHLHTALVQVLVACRPRILAPPEDAFLARWLMPLLPAPLP